MPSNLVGWGGGGGTTGAAGNRHDHEKTGAFIMETDTQPRISTGEKIFSLSMLLPRRGNKTNDMQCLSYICYQTKS